MRTLIRSGKRLFAFVVVLAAVGCASSHPVTYTDRMPEAALPWLTGRVAYLSGDVQIAQPGESEDSRGWRAALVNDVVTSGTNVYAAPGASAEIRIGGHALRIAENSRVVVRSVDADRSAIQLDQGSLNVRWRDYEPQGRVDVFTPAGRIELLGPGGYRIDAQASSSMVTVFQGRAQVPAANTMVSVGPSKALTLSGSNYSFSQATSTAFDEWALTRDERVARAPRYVSPYMTGADELDIYGRWVVDPNYGNVWVPASVPSGWAPYRYGQWRWVAPWGWTWVDDAPWGFAPFHYGRWIYSDSRWAWFPGAYSARPIYAPALVGFTGRPGVSVSVSIGSPPSAWYPLSPWQTYQPWYPHSPSYVTTINQTVIVRPVQPGYVVGQPPIGVSTIGDLRQQPIAPARGAGQTVQPYRPGAMGSTLLIPPQQGSDGQPMSRRPDPRFVAPSAMPRPQVLPAQPVAPNSAPPISPNRPQPIMRLNPPMSVDPIERNPREVQRFLGPPVPAPVQRALPQPTQAPPIQPIPPQGIERRQLREFGERGHGPPMMIR